MLRGTWRTSRSGWESSEEESWGPGLEVAAWRRRRRNICLIVMVVGRRLRQVDDKTGHSWPQDWPLMATRVATHGHKTGHSWPQYWPLMASGVYQENLPTHSLPLYVQTTSWKYSSLRSESYT